MRTVLVSALALVIPFVLAPALADPVPVAAAGFSYVSPVLVVPVGTTVTWMGELFPHTVTTDAGGTNSLMGIPNDPTNSDGNPDTWNAALPQGGSFSHTFANAGVFNYHCQLHHTFGMVGVVIVVDPNTLP